MTGPPDVSLSFATERDAPVLANLLELYVHDLSEIFPVALGADGRYGYDRLHLYWSEPGRRFPFLVHAKDELAGFALATRGSPATDDPNDLDVAEFFVTRRHRRGGVGRRAACMLWDRLPGRWIVRVSQGNRGGMAFWSGVIAAYARGAHAESTRPGTPFPWRVFSFESRPPRA
jgi:predicted acetyltransferase